MTEIHTNQCLYLLWCRPVGLASTSGTASQPKKVKTIFAVLTAAYVRFHDICSQSAGFEMAFTSTSQTLLLRTRRLVETRLLRIADAVCRCVQCVCLNARGCFLQNGGHLQVSSSVDATRQSKSPLLAPLCVKVESNTVAYLGNVKYRIASPNMLRLKLYFYAFHLVKRSLPPNSPASSRTAKCL